VRTEYVEELADGAAVAVAAWPDEAGLDNAWLGEADRDEAELDDAELADPPDVQADTATRADRTRRSGT
jgi:hypothetical protein